MGKRTGAIDGIIMKQMIVILIGVCIFFLVCPACAFSDDGGGAWTSVQNITIQKNAGSKLSLYQVLIKLNQNNFDFSRAQQDGHDIRFTISDGIGCY
jgi:hypothetical protein